MNFGLCRPCAIGTGERRNKTCQSLINLVSSCVLKLDNASVDKSLDNAARVLLVSMSHAIVRANQKRSFWDINQSDRKKVIDNACS